MKRVLLMLLAMCLAFPVMAEPGEREPECWIVSHGCLTDFLQAWSEDNHEAMLALCAPSWKAQQADPQLTLFLLLRNRTALAWSIREKAAEDADRLYDVDILLEDYSGREPQWYRFAFRVALEDGVRYVDPEGLRTGDATAAPENHTLPETSLAEQPGSWWHEAGAWNHAGDPALWAEHNARFAAFMEAWMNRDVEAVQTYLRPGWMPDADNSEWEFQRRFYIYVPLSYTIESVVVAADTRRVTYSVQIIDDMPDYSVKAVSFSVDMYWDAGAWYVDPNGLPEVQK